MGLILLGVFFVLSINGIFSYRMPNITMEAKYPSGFRVFIPDQRGIEEFGFNANINEPLESYEPGEISAEVKEKRGQFWVFQDDDIGLEPGDALYYWAYVVFRGVVYKRVRQKWVCINFVREFSNISPPRRPNVHPQRPPFFHPLGFIPHHHHPWSNFTTKAPSPTLPGVESATTKRSVEVSVSTAPPSSPPQTTTASTTVTPTTTEVIEPKTATTIKTPEPETTTVAQVTTITPEVMTTTPMPEPETTPTPEVVTTTRIPEPETTTAAQMTTTAQEVMTTTPMPEPETTSAPEVVTTTRIPEPETTTAQMTTTGSTAAETTTNLPTTAAPTTIVPVTSGFVTPNFCNESIPTVPTEDTIATTMEDVTPRPYAPPVYWPSNREDCLNVWSSTYRPFMTRLKMTKSVILLECQVASQKRKMTRVRSELFNLRKFNYEVETRLEAIERKVFGHPEAVPSKDEESE